MAYVQPLELTGEQTAERSFLAKVYGWMVAGLSATAFTAWWIARDEALLRGVLSHLQGILLAGFLLPLALSYVVYRMAKPMAVGGFFLYALYEGVVLSVAFAFVDSQVLVSAFLLTGGIFAVMALWGYFTRSDLSSVGSLASMLLLGLVLASIVNLFVASDALGWLVTYGIVAAVCALTAYDVQRLKKIAQGVGPSGEAVLERAAITGAFVLYIDFIILFWQILRILSASSRRN